MAKRKPKPSYKELLRRPEWLRKRADMIELYDSICQRCRKKTDLLTIHHRYYVAGRMPWQYPDWALPPVCDTPCHWQMHEDSLDTFAEWECAGGAPEPIPVSPVAMPITAPDPEPDQPVGEEAATARFAAIFDMLGKL